MSITAENILNYPRLSSISRIDRTISDEMWGADLDFIDCNDMVSPHIPIFHEVTDRNGDSCLLFLGVCPGQEYKYSSISDNYTLSAYSIEYYLTNQFVPWNMLESKTTTKTTTDSDGNETTTIVDYENPTNIVKRLLFKYNDSDLSLVSPLTPVLNIEVGVINDVPNWGAMTSKPGGDSANYIPVYDSNYPIVSKQQFKFDTKTTRMEAIQKICDETHMIFFCKIYKVAANTFTIKGYLIHEDDIDKYLPLPEPVIIYADDPFVKEEVSVKQDYVEIPNRVTVHAVNPRTGYWTHQTVETAEVTAGRTALEYSVETSTMFGTEYDEVSTDSDAVKAQKKAQMDALALAEAKILLDFFQTPDTVYTLRLENYLSLELYQKASFIGFDKIPNTPLRITGLSHSDEGNGVIVTDVTASHDTRLALAKKLKRLYGQDYQRDQQKMEEDFFVDLTKIESGIIVSCDYKTGGAVVKLDRTGSLVLCRLLNRSTDI